MVETHIRTGRSHVDEAMLIYGLMKGLKQCVFQRCSCRGIRSCWVCASFAAIGVMNGGCPSRSNAERGGEPMREMWEDDVCHRCERHGSGDERRLSPSSTSSKTPPGQSTRFTSSNIVCHCRTMSHRQSMGVWIHTLFSGTPRAIDLIWT